jgi:hypothetical protein
VLIPHDPRADPAAPAATITAIRDDGDCTVLKLADGHTVRLIVLNTSGRRVTAETVTTDAEAALLTTVQGKPSHLSAWHATHASLAGQVLHESDKPVDLDREVVAPGQMRLENSGLAPLGWHNGTIQ